MSLHKLCMSRHSIVEHIQLAPTLTHIQKQTFGNYRDKIFIRTTQVNFTYRGTYQSTDAKSIDSKIPAQVSFVNRDRYSGTIMCKNDQPISHYTQDCFST